MNADQPPPEPEGPPPEPEEATPEQAHRNFVRTLVEMFGWQEPAAESEYRRQMAAGGLAVQE